LQPDTRGILRQSGAAEWLAGLVLLSGLALTWLAYQPGLGGSLHFDDAPNLSWLGQVAQGNDAFTHVMGGRAGPLGRPLALASFVPEAYAWPDLPNVFLRTNILLHLVNGLLVAWLGLRLARQLRRTSVEATWISALCACLWVSLPLLASSTLLVVQRMNLLSATFLLGGLIGYLAARETLDRRPRLAMLGMTASLVVGGMLSILAKENGALLPLYALAFEVTLAPRACVRYSRFWLVWRLVFLWLPLCALTWYLATRLPYSDGTIRFRQFSGADRLLTEAHILWEYLRQALLPQPQALGPYHDAHAIYRDWINPTTLFACGSLLGTAALAVALRRRAPLFTFATVWFLLGHSLESTTLPLELYFEHRNYLPVFGPAFALVAGLAQLPTRARRVICFALPCYLALLLFNLHSVSSLWGHAELASILWLENQPDSLRATQTRARHLQLAGKSDEAIALAERFLARHPEESALRIQTVHLACSIADADKRAELVAELMTGVSEAPYRTATVNALSALFEVVGKGNCRELDTSLVTGLAEALLQNPAYLGARDARSGLHLILAQIGIEKRNLDMTMGHLEAAYAAQPLLSTTRLTAAVLISAGLYEAARETVGNAAQHAPANPVKRLMRQHELTRLRRQVERSIAVAEKRTSQLPTDSEETRAIAP
jgi:tetratricopeptide (TPR) repeat protein